MNPVGVRVHILNASTDPQIANVTHCVTDRCYQLIADSTWIVSASRLIHAPNVVSAFLH